MYIAYSIIYIAFLIKIAGEIMDNKEFVKYIKSKEITFKYANGMRDIYGRELHIYNEIFCFLGGNAEFISAYGRKKLEAGMIVIIPKDTFHQFVNKGNDSNYCRCVLNFDNVSELDFLIENKIKDISVFNSKEIKDLFDSLIKIANSPYSESEKSILLKSIFAQILVAVNTQNTIQKIGNKSNYSLSYQIMSFLNQNITKELLIEDIAKNFNTSPSHLSRIFKLEFNISIHKYILENRLIIAHRLISNSTPATLAAQECGFPSYPNFYRQYIKMFGCSPSKNKNI